MDMLATILWSRSSRESFKARSMKSASATANWTQGRKNIEKLPFIRIFSSGFCPSLPDRGYAPVRNPINDQCPSYGTNYPAPTYAPTYRPPVVPSWAPQPTWKPIASAVPFYEPSDSDSVISFNQSGEPEPGSSISGKNNFQREILTILSDSDYDYASSSDDDLFGEEKWAQFDRMRRRKRVHE